MSAAIMYASVYATEAGLWVSSSAKDPDWILVSAEPFFSLLPGCSNEEVGLAVMQALQASGRTLTRREVGPQLQALSRLVGTRSWADFEREARLANVVGGPREVVIKPMRRGTRGGFVSTNSDPKTVLSANAPADSIGEAVLDALAVTNLWSVRAPPPAKARETKTTTKSGSVRARPKKPPRRRRRDSC